MKRGFGAPALCLCLLLAACSPRSASPAEGSIFAMDTEMSFTVYGTQADLSTVTQTVFGLDTKLSVTRPESLVSRLNRQGRVERDGDLDAILETADWIWYQTQGALDVTLYPIVRAWGFTTGEHAVPSRETLDALLERVDQGAVTLTDDAVLLPRGMELDLGALAKGYAGEKCARQLRERGVDSAILRLGGNIQTVGRRPDGSPWRVGVQDPAGGSEDFLGVLEVEDRAVVTSGGYQRYFEENGVRYHHIMSAVTGEPARSGLTSVTVVAESGTLADGLSTALFVMGREVALEFWRDWREDFEAILVEDTGEVWITPGLRDTFTLSPGEYTLRVWEA